MCRHDNDRPILKHTRRTALITAGASVLTIAGLPALAASVATTPEETEGPYWVDEKLNRTDVRESQAGFPLGLEVTVAYISGSTTLPLRGAYVDVWSANASGLYSDESANNTTGQTFCRGYQTTDRHGIAKFTTIYPGWYSGRTPHIHCRVRTYSGSTETFDFTTQFFFSETVTNSVYTKSPYSSRGKRDTTNSTDSVLQQTLKSDPSANMLLKLRQRSTYATGVFNMILSVS
jgi:protocatechuate 3,4-dioxygenase beta subunit